MRTACSTPSRTSAFASTMRSSDPKRSRCTGPMAVMTPMRGRTQSHSSEISPEP